MSNLVPFQQTTSAEESLAQRLRSSCGKCLAVSRTAAGDWVLAPTDALTSQALRAGVAAIEDELRGGPPQRLAMALTRMMATTSKPPWMDDMLAAAYAETLPEAMMDYPADVVEEAFAAWRKTPVKGKWWPTEQDIREIADKLFAPRKELKVRAQALLYALESEEGRDERSRQPSQFAGDKHREFRNEMRKRMEPGKFDAYFHASQIKYQGEDVILVRSPGAERVLREIGADLLKRMKISLRFCQQSWLHERTVEPEEPTTDEERHEIAEKMRALARSISAASAPKPPPPRMRPKPPPPEPPPQKTEKEIWGDLDGGEKDSP